MNQHNEMNQLQVFIGFSPPSIAAAQSFAAQLGALFVTQYWHQKRIILPRQARDDQTQKQVCEQKARLIIFSADRLESHAVGGGLQFHIGHQVRKPRRRLPLFTHAKKGRPLLPRQAQDKRTGEALKSRRRCVFVFLAISSSNRGRS